MIKRVLILILLLCGTAQAQEVVTSYDKSSLPVLNEELRSTRSMIKQNETAIVPFSRGGTNTALPTIAQGTMFYVDSTGVGIGTVAIGTSGKVLISNGTTPEWGYGIGQVSYTTPGTYYWTAPTGNNLILLSVVGGGGGGAGSSGLTGGGSGGAGGYVENILVNVTPGSTYTIIVGSGGSYGSNSSGCSDAASSPGTNGENSSFNTGSITITAIGGSGGSYSQRNASVIGTGGSGGGCSGVISSRCISGTSGENGGDMYTVKVGGVSASYNSAGGRSGYDPGSGYVSPVSPVGYGSGGATGNCQSGSVNGQNGNSGAVFIMY